MKTDEIVQLLTPKCSECAEPMLHFCIEYCCRETSLFCSACQADMHFLHNTHRLELLLTDEVAGRGDGEHWKTILDRLQQILTRVDEVELYCRQTREHVAAFLRDAQQKSHSYNTKPNRWERDLLESVKQLKAKEISVEEATKRFQQGARNIDVCQESDLSFSGWERLHTTVYRLHDTASSVHDVCNDLSDSVCTPAHKNLYRRRAFLISLATGTFVADYNEYGQHEANERPRMLEQVLDKTFGKGFAEKSLSFKKRHEAETEDFELPAEREQLRRISLNIVTSPPTLQSIRGFFRALPQLSQLRHLAISSKRGVRQQGFLRVINTELVRAAVRCKLYHLRIDRRLEWDLREAGTDFKEFAKFSRQYRSAMLQSQLMESCTFIRNMPLIYKQELLQVWHNWDHSDGLRPARQ